VSEQRRDVAQRPLDLAPLPLCVRRELVIEVRVNHDAAAISSGVPLSRASTSPRGGREIVSGRIECDDAQAIAALHDSSVLRSTRAFHEVDRVRRSSTACNWLNVVSDS
jgi:hypothetical protein